MSCHGARLHHTDSAKRDAGVAQGELFEAITHPVFFSGWGEATADEENNRGPCRRTEHPERLLSLTLLAPTASSVDEISNGTMMGQPFGALSAESPFDLKGQALGPAFVKGLKGFDPYAGIERYRGPVFTHDGEADEVVPIA